LKKIGLVNWPDWKNSFLTVFVDKGWSRIRKAYNYKHFGGSLVDYALTKEKLCLDAESSGTTQSRINMIVVGLPLEVQDELDCEEITSIEKLFVELRKLDDAFSKKKKEVTSKSETTSKSKDKLEDKRKKPDKQDEKKPCFMCAALGWPNHYHPTSECRNKNVYSTKIKEVNLNETNTISEVLQASSNASLN